MPQYTIIQQGHHWIASDGQTHAEGDEPETALLALLDSAEDDGDDLPSAAPGEWLLKIIRAAGSIIALAATGSPPAALDHQIEVLRTLAREKPTE